MPAGTMLFIMVQPGVGKQGDQDQGKGEGKDSGSQAKVGEERPPVEEEVHQARHHEGPAEHFVQHHDHAVFHMEKEHDPGDRDDRKGDRNER